MNDHPTLEEASAAVREHITDDYTRLAGLGPRHPLVRASALVELLAQLARAAAIESVPESTSPTDADGLRQNLAAYKRQIERYRHRFEQLAQAVLGDAYDLDATSAQVLPQALAEVERLHESAECDHDGVPPGEWCLACHKPKPITDQGTGWETETDVAAELLEQAGKARDSLSEHDDDRERHTYAKGYCKALEDVIAGVTDVPGALIGEASKPTDLSNGGEWPSWCESPAGHEAETDPDSPTGERCKHCLAWRGRRRETEVTPAQFHANRLAAIRAYQDRYGSDDPHRRPWIRPCRAPTSSRSGDGINRCSRWTDAQVEAACEEIESEAARFVTDGEDPDQALVMAAAHLLLQARGDTGSPEPCLLTTDQLGQAHAEALEIAESQAPRRPGGDRVVSGPMDSERLSDLREKIARTEALTRDGHGGVVLSSEAAALLADRDHWADEAADLRASLRATAVASMMGAGVINRLLVDDLAEAWRRSDVDVEPLRTIVSMLLAAEGRQELREGESVSELAARVIGRRTGQVSS